jgi:hypothetical protein
MRRLTGWFLKVVLDAPHETLISLARQNGMEQIESA